MNSIAILFLEGMNAFQNGDRISIFVIPPSTGFPMVDVVAEHDTFVELTSNEIESFGLLMNVRYY